MDPAIAKTLTFLSFILIGVLLKKKFSNKEQVNGLKNIILTIALPSTIFVALMGVEINSTMLVFPLLALAFNFVIFILTPLLIKLLGINPNTSKGRTLKLLLPSLAPGLSCFPFILEYLGETSLADAALADVGNKFFVLIFLYVIAMNMFYQINENKDSGSKGKMKELLLSLIAEPINIIIVLALVLLSLGFNFETLPAFISDVFSRLSLIMTPLVLVFIGLAVKLRKESFWPVFNVLLVRAGITLIFSALVIFGFGLKETNAILLAIVFPLSSCSFWPFAHMSVFNKKEKESGKTFDIEYAVLVLALSLPISTILILGILSSGSFFANPAVSALSGVVLIAFVLVGQLIKKLSFSSIQFGVSESKKLIEQTE
ncbi:MAG TPA: hypothetical protein VIN11_05130 [Roseivirga sp.]